MLIFTLAGLVLFAASRGYAHASTRGLLYLGSISVLACIPAILLILNWNTYSMSFKACVFGMLLFCGVFMPLFPKRWVPPWQTDFADRAKTAHRLLGQLELERFPGLIAVFRDPVRDRFRGTPHVLIKGTIESKASLILLQDQIEILRRVEHDEIDVAWSVKINETGELFDRQYWERDRTKPSG